MPSGPPMVMVADDSPAFAETATGWLTRHGFSTMSPVTSREALYGQLALANPRVLFLDVVWGKTDILSDLRAMVIAYPGTLIIMISGHPAPGFVDCALQCGAQGFVIKGEFDEMGEAIECVLAGRIFLSAEIRTTARGIGVVLGVDLMKKVQCGKPGEPLYEGCVAWISLVTGISRRQAEVCLGFRDGHTLKELARHIGCSQGTLGTHVTRVYDHLEDLGWDRSEVAAAVYAERLPQESSASVGRAVAAAQRAEKRKTRAGRLVGRRRWRLMSKGS